MVVEHGASIVATNPDPYRPTPQGPQPDSASILAAIEACTGTRAEAVLGKPSLAMGSALLDRLGTAPGDSALVGDRLVTDVPMGQSIDMASVLVLGGATSVDEVVDSTISITRSRGSTNCFPSRSGPMVCRRVKGAAMRRPLLAGPLPRPHGMMQIADTTKS